MSLQELRVVSKRLGGKAPASFEEYRADGGYVAFEKLLSGFTTISKAITQLEKSGLRGRGGAGFPTGRKWRAVSDAVCTRRRREGGSSFVIANGDEGDPGAYMDRSLMEYDAHAIIEGMLIAGFCLGAEQGFLFTRAEYAAAAAAFEVALREVRERGYLGNAIGGTEFSFDVSVVKSGGNYLCGEESALIDALENHVGLPRGRRCYPSEKGLWDVPTLVNNVETLANVPRIIKEGAQAFRRLGTPECPGTKLLCVVGGKARSGLVEVEMGTSLQTLIEDFTADDPGHYKAVQIGGPSGEILPIDADVRMDFDSLMAHGGIMGSGGVVLLSRDDCIVETVRYFIVFSRVRSCGRCKSCGEGLAECATIMNRLVRAEGAEGDLARLDALCGEIPKGSMCGLGKSSTRVLRSALDHFRAEFEAHVLGVCPALVCKPLVRFEIVPDLCPGCRCCLPTCPTNAMQGRFGKPFTINQRLCERCKMCMATCPYYAVRVVTG